MTLRDVLAKNFKKLREANPALFGLDVLADMDVSSRGTLDRVLKSKVNVGLDLLEPLARAYSVEPWQLLHPEFEPGKSMDETSKPLARRYGHMAQSIALLVDQIPDSEELVKTQMLIAVSQISREWNERQKSMTPSEQDQKKPTRKHQAKT